MKARLHRGGYEASMNTAKEVEPTVEALAAFFATDAFGGFVPTGIEVTKYGHGTDDRNGWNTHIVTGLIGDHPQPVVLGFTDSGLPEITP